MQRDERDYGGASHKLVSVRVCRADVDNGLTPFYRMYKYKKSRERSLVNFSPCVLDKRQCQVHYFFYVAVELLAFVELV